MLRGQREQRVIDAVVGQDYQRPFPALSPCARIQGGGRADLSQRIGRK